jgi:hypothetical protein
MELREAEWRPDGRGDLTPRPMKPVEVLRTTRALVKANLAPIASVMAVFVFPVYLAWAFVSPDDMSWTSPFMPPLPLATLTWFGSLPVAAAGRGAVILLGFAGVGLAVAMITRLTARSYLSRHPSAPERPAAAGRRLPAVVAAFASIHLLEADGLLLFIATGLALTRWSSAAPATVVVVLLLAVLAAIPAIALLAMTLLFVTMPALVVERRTVLGALRRSLTLIRRRFWSTAAVVTLGGLAAMILLVAVHFPFALMFSASNFDGRFPPGAWVIESLGGMLASLAAIPFFVTLATVVYFDLRVRRDGLTQEAIARDLRSLG